MCAELGVHHFTRKGSWKRWNQPKGAHKAKTKHGNYNAWLDAHGDATTSCSRRPRPRAAAELPGADPRLLPRPRRRLRRRPTGLRQLRQPRHRGAEVAAVPVPRADPARGNRSRRGDVRRHQQRRADHRAAQIGGLYDSITEDMATGLEVHATRNPRPAALALGLHPGRARRRRGADVVGDYFSQQQRWSRGTDEVLIEPFLRLAFTRLAAGAGPLPPADGLLPDGAISWVLGAVNAMLSFTLGAGGVVVPRTCGWCSTVDAAALQVGLYFWNRRHNVSPHEKEGSAGVAGMLISALSAPIYAASLAAVLLRLSGGLSPPPEGRRQHARQPPHVPQALALGDRLRGPASPLVRARPPPHLDAGLIASRRCSRRVPAAGGDLAGEGAGRGGRRGGAAGGRRARRRGWREAAAEAVAQREALSARPRPRPRRPSASRPRRGRRAGRRREPAERLRAPAEEPAAEEGGARGPRGAEVRRPSSCGPGGRRGGAAGRPSRPASRRPSGGASAAEAAAGRSIAARGADAGGRRAQGSGRGRAQARSAPARELAAHGRDAGEPRGEKPVRRERSEPGRRDHLKPVPDQPREPAVAIACKPARTTAASGTSSCGSTGARPRIVARPRARCAGTARRRLHRLEPGARRGERGRQAARGDQFGHDDHFGAKAVSTALRAEAPACLLALAPG